MYVCIRELCCFYLSLFQEVQPDDLLVARHVVGQVDQTYHRRRPRQAYRPDVQPVHRVLHEAEDVLHAAPRPRLLLSDSSSSVSVGWES